jgi:hypothetical protein
LTGRKFTNEADIEHYKSFGDERYGGIMEFGSLVKEMLLVKDLDLARDIFIKDFDHFFDQRDFPKTDILMTNTLFFMEGKPWKDMRAFLKSYIYIR